MDATINKSNRIFGLDAMRAAAILMVMCSHILWIYPNSNTIVYQVFSLLGYFGVEIFFVLSGFLIGNILYRLYIEEEFTVKSVFYFLKRRWFRTLPNYFLILSINLIIAYFIGISVKDKWSYFLFLQNFSGTINPFFPESWSLCVEEFAYFVTPLALLTGFYLINPKNKPKQFLYIILLLIGMFFLNRIYYNATTENQTLAQWNISLKSVVIYRIDSILIGVTASWININCLDFWQKQKIVLAFAAWILMILMFVGVGFFGLLINKYSFFWNVIYLPMTSFIFALTLPVFSEWKLAPKWISIPITFISKISYSIYLLHYSIILFLMKFYISTSFFSNFQLHILVFSYIIITFFSSFFLYRYFEKPIMNLRGK